MVVAVAYVCGGPKPTSVELIHTFPGHNDDGVSRTDELDGCHYRPITGTASTDPTDWHASGVIQQPQPQRSAYGFLRVVSSGLEVIDHWSELSWGQRLHCPQQRGGVPRGGGRSGAL